MDKKLIAYTLYLISDRNVLKGKDLLDSIEAAIKGGVTLVQLREKSMEAGDFLTLALKVKELVGKYKVPLIINDRVDIVLAADADGVHLGPEDLPVKTARMLLGPDKIIGASANCIEEALLFQEQGADYLGVGALFPTSTKKDTEHVSIEELKAIKAVIHIPIVGIGGVKPENTPLVMSAGVDGIAVASAILGSEDVNGAASEFRRQTAKNIH